ncbi:SDR family NAD(P)-dependent oxidoreductase [Rubrimonas sp.]|uniref:SDR family NAD(P)-dependent oxidoreductase n=1 Tax=Rubrimonas sp. TaxID=2036015 RepID=UPI002FDD3F99
MGRTVFVTGGANGIGLASAAAFARLGDRVAVGDIDERGAATAAAALPGAVAVRVDVTDRGSVEAAFAEVEAQLGPIDVLHANAGVSTMARAVDLTDEDWEFNFAVNARGVFLTNQIMARRTLAAGRRAAIVNTASLAAKVGAPLLAHYSASKFAVVGWTQALARELAPHGVRVNAVCPGFVKTPMQDREIRWEAQLLGRTPEAVLQSYVDQTPLGRLETPEDVADVVTFLASDGARFMTGQAINVTGGVYMT